MVPDYVQKAWLEKVEKDKAKAKKPKKPMKAPETYLTTAKVQQSLTPYASSEMVYLDPRELDAPPPSVITRYTDANQVVTMELFYWAQKSGVLPHPWLVVQCEVQFCIHFGV